jgi:hypothetical protein
MPFINNQKDNFKKSDSAWGDDNITYYNMPKAKSVERMGGTNIQDMSYQDLEDTITQISSVQPSTQQDMALLDEKLMLLRAEMSKRDELESVTREEREDNFEPKDTIVKEDVVEDVVEDISEPVITTPNINIMPDNMTLEPVDNTNDYIIAGLIIILVVNIID